MESFKRYLASYALGHLPSEDIPHAALCALELGHGSPAMAALAGEPSITHPADLRSAFDAALCGLGLELPSGLEAAELLKHEIAADACAGSRSARDAAQAIVDVYNTIENELPRKPSLGEAFDIADLVGAFYSLDDAHVDPAARAAVESDLANALRRLGGPQGRWAGGH
jgi:hypothetical protein